jgi:alanine racemase
MKIGVLPIGYNDGMDRRLSNIGIVSLKGTLCPIVGRVSMNLTTIDMTHSPDVKIGDEVVFIDEKIDSPVCLFRQCERAQMIPYDMLVHLNKEMFRTKE